MLNEATFEVFGPVRKVEASTSGKKWVRVTIPVDVSYIDSNDNRVERTTWFEAVCFKPKLIEIIGKLNVQDRRVRIKGTIEIGTREFQSKQIKETSFLIDQLDLTDPKPRD